MSLDVRKMRILQAVINDYILSAAPVGSRTISKYSDIGLSSATIRNEMSDLEELGFLQQPHTSAGRIPSDKAYRLYVNDIMQRSRLSDEEISYIRSQLKTTFDDVEQVVRQTAWILSSMTGYTAMIMTPQASEVKVKHIQLVPVTEGRALAVIVTDSGIMRDSIIKVPHSFDYDYLERLSRLLTERFSNRKLSDINKIVLPELFGTLGENAEFLNSMVDAVESSLAQGARSVQLSGTNNLLSHPEYSDIERARQLLAILENRNFLYKTLKNAQKVSFSFTIGSENSEPGMQDCSIVTATYSVGNEPMGSFGIIGPTRMDYSHVLAVLEYMGGSLSSVLTSILREEQDDE